ncbi:hypothetical protein D3C86_843050 [compost metagenome]
MTVVPSPLIIQNNSISLSGSEMLGSIPNGGVGEYTYRWYAYALEGEDPWIIGESKNCTVPPSVYNFMFNMGLDNIKVVREVTSGSQTSTSNYVTVYPIPIQDISNNIIIQSGQNIIGSLPSGGFGSFRYEYYLYQEFDGEILGIYNVGNEQNFTLASNYGGLVTKIYRKVFSGDKVSNSNVITVLQGSSAKKSIVNNSETPFANLTVFPNPASEFVSFSTNFSTNEEIEIVIYSENLANQKSIFRGTIVPNQVIKWNIPSNYPKGLYFYKMLSGNREIKTGKIIFQ